MSCIYIYIPQGLEGLAERRIGFMRESRSTAQNKDESDNDNRAKNMTQSLSPKPILIFFKEVKERCRMEGQEL